MVVSMTKLYGCFNYESALGLTSIYVYVKFNTGHRVNLQYPGRKSPSFRLLPRLSHILVSDSLGKINYEIIIIENLNNFDRTFKFVDPFLFENRNVFARLA